MDVALAQYAEKGFATVRDLLGPADIAMLRSEWARLWSETATGHASVQWRGHLVEGQKADRLDPAHVLSPQLQNLCSDRRIVALAERALGAPALFFKDKLITKGSGTLGYGLHQDWPYWAKSGIPADAMVTVMVAIDSCNAGNGTLELWPKEPRPLPSPADEPLDVDPVALRTEHGELVELSEGDALLLHPLVPHRSGVNRSADPRRAYFITYAAARSAA